MAFTRHASRRFRARHGESLEARTLLAADRLFEAHELTETFGDAGQIEAVGDFDGDKIDDLVISSLWPYEPGPDNAALRLNRNTNRFELVAKLISRGDSVHYAVQSSLDIDHDGDFDLLLSEIRYHDADLINDFYWLENSDGRGKFTELHRITQHQLGGSISVVDIEGDGDWDLTYMGYHNMGTQWSEWYENAGNGQFQAHYLGTVERNSPFYPNWYDVDGDGEKFVGQTPTDAIGRQHLDIDGDGDLDVLDHVEYLTTTLAWLENVAPNALFVSQAIPKTPGRVEAAYPQDVDHDGDYDFWIYNNLGNLVTLQENLGGAVFRAHTMPDVKIYGTPQLADLDGDGRRELITLNGAQGLLYEYNVEPTTFKVTVTTHEMPRREIAQAAVDFDRDGDIDLVGQVGWYEQSKNTPERWIRHDYGLKDVAIATTAFDVNGDKQADLVAAISIKLGTVELRWYDFADADAGQPPQEIILGRVNNVRRFMAEDVDADGRFDLVVDDGSTELSWWANRGGNLVQQTGSPRGELIKAACQTCTPLFSPSSIVADIDGDGDRDIVAVHERVVRWHENKDGAGLFDMRGRKISQTQNVVGIHAADFNGDGDIDLAVEVDRNYSNLCCRGPGKPPVIDVFLFDNQDGLGAFVEVTDDLPFAGSVSLAVDLNGDRRAEILQQPSGDLSGIVVHRNVTRPDYPIGDVNRDGELSIADIDRLSRAIHEHDTDTIFDLDGDHLLTLDDFTTLVENILRIRYGDANNNGTFDSSDLIRVFQRRQYEKMQSSPIGWGDGDWNGDGRFDSSDLVAAFTHGKYEEQVRDASILIASREADKVIRYDGKTGEYIADFALLDAPIDIAQGLDGDIYVVQQTSSGTLSRFRPDGTLVAAVDRPGDGGSLLHVGPNGDIYVMSWSRHMIERFSTSGGQLHSLGIVANLGNIAPDAFTVGPDGDLYVATRLPKQVLRFDGGSGALKGTFVDFRGIDGFTEGYLEGLAFGPDGDFYVGVGWSEGSLYRFSPAGEFREIFISGIDYDYGHLRPVFTEDGYILFALWGAEDRVVRYDAKTGQWIDVLIDDDAGGLNEAMGMIYQRPN